TPPPPTHAAPTRLIHTKRLKRLKTMQQQGGAVPGLDERRQMRTSYERAGRRRVLIHPSVPFCTGVEPVGPCPGYTTPSECHPSGPLHASPYTKRHWMV